MPVNNSVTGKEFCFTVNGNTNTNAADLIFMLGEGDIIMLEPSMTMADVVVAAEIYESKSRARKDGWFQPIPIGFYDKEIGKLHTHIYIWNPSKSPEDYTDDYPEGYVPEDNFEDD